MIGTSFVRRTSRGDDAQDVPARKRPRLKAGSAPTKVPKRGHLRAPSTLLPAEIFTEVAMYCAPRDICALADTHPAIRNALAINVDVLRHAQYGHYARALRAPLPSLPLRIDMLQAAGTLDAHHIESLPGAGCMSSYRRGLLGRIDADDESAWLDQYDDMRRLPSRVPHTSVSGARFVDLGASEQLTVFDRNERRLLRWDLSRKEKDAWGQQANFPSEGHKSIMAFGSHAAVRLSGDGRFTEIDIADPQRTDLRCAVRPLEMALAALVISDDGGVLVGQLLGYTDRRHRAFELRDGRYVPLGPDLLVERIKHIYRSRATQRLLLQCVGRTGSNELFTLARGDAAYRRVYLPRDVSTKFSSASLSYADEGVYLTYPSRSGDGSVSHWWVPLRTHAADRAPSARSGVMQESQLGHPGRCVEWIDGEPDSIAFSDADTTVKKAVPDIFGYARATLLYASPCATFAVLTFRGAIDAQARSRGDYARSESLVPRMLLPVWYKDRDIRFFEPVWIPGLLKVSAHVGPGGPVFAAYLPHGRLVVSTQNANDRQANLFSLRELHDSTAPRAAGFGFSRDGARLHWLGAERSSRRTTHYALSTVDLATGAVGAQRFTHHSRTLRLLSHVNAESRDGRRVVAADEDGHVLVLRAADARDGTPPQLAPPRRRAAM